MSKNVTRPLATKTVEKFYVSFYNMAENEGNILGREVKSIERPNVNFMEMDIRNKGIKNLNSARLEYNPITISFFDDTMSYVNRALYSQIMRQTGKKDPSFSDASFSIKIKIYTTDGLVAEEHELGDCHINNISHSESIYEDSSNNIITISVSFNSLNSIFPVIDGDPALNTYNYLSTNDGDQVITSDNDNIVI